MMDNILENKLIARIAGGFRKSPHKLNDIHETDAEIIDLGTGCESYLAITTDALVEEISSGLYDDPYLIGWMLAMVNFSDLAAVGADPLGLLVAVNFAADQDDAFLDKLSSGISAACERLGTFVLGGDTNQGRSMSLCGTAVGTIPKQRVIRRVGARPKDKLYLTAPAGLGNVYAFLRLVQSGFKIPPGLYQPTARIAEGRLIRQFAACCMDTSDGVVHTVDTLMRLNHCQFVLDADWEKTIHPFALQVCRSQGLPPWLVLAAVHGEFELCFTVGPQKEDGFLRAAETAGWAPVLIGAVEEGEGVRIRTKDKKVPVDTAAVRNLSDEAGSNPRAYLEHLLDIAREVGL
jgi:thiamine-monophosphate kinase